MKISTKLGTIISGPIGKFSGAMSSGGCHLRAKMAKAPPRSNKQKQVLRWGAMALKAWERLPQRIRNQWIRHGKYLKNRNQVWHMVRKSGFHAFCTAYVCCKQSGFNTDYLLNHAPVNRGYSRIAEFRVYKQRGYWYLVPKTPVDYSCTVSISQKFKNTINTNSKGYNFYKTHIVNMNRPLKLPAHVKDGRFFIRIRRIMTDGEHSRAKVFKWDL